MTEKREKSNLERHAEAEFAILRKTWEPGDSMLKFYEDCTAMVLPRFDEDGHSGGSAPFAIRGLTQVLDKLLSWEPLSPLTGEDDEWMDVGASNGGQQLYQNRRCSHVFKDETGAWDIDAVVYRHANGACFTRGGMGLDGNRVTFPYTPARRYVDVDDAGKEIYPARDAMLEALRLELWGKDDPADNPDFVMACDRVLIRLHQLGYVVAKAPPA